MTKKHQFRVGFFCCGLGGMALGAMDAIARLGNDTAEAVIAGAVDIKPEACRNFEYLTGHRATVGDISTMDYVDTRRIFGEECLDMAWISAPCKGFSQLLPKKSAEKEHYQKLNRLLLQTVELCMGAWGGEKDWRGLPGTLTIENVQGIKTRGAKLLLQVKGLLHQRGYIFHEEVYDCGAFSAEPDATQGGPAHRPRYLLVARHPKKVPAFVHNPRSLPLQGCGNVLFKLPLPDDPDAGPMHRSPRLGIITMARLAAIPKGKDWRALPMSGAQRAGNQEWMDEVKKRRLQLIAPTAGHGLASNKHLVLEPMKPARTVTGSSRPGSGGAAVADPREELLGFNHQKFGDCMGVLDPASPAPTVRGQSRPDNAPTALADPREELLATTHRDNRFSDQYRVRDGSAPMATVTGRTDVQEGAPVVSDPRLALLTATRQEKRRRGQFQVRDPKEPMCTVTGQSEVQEGAPALADPRVQMLARATGSGPNLMAVLDPARPALTVTARASVSSSNAAAAVSDTRAQALISPPRGCRNGFYGVMDPEHPASTVTGHGDVCNGVSAVADFRRGAFGRIILTFDEALTLVEKKWKYKKGELPPFVVSPHDGEVHRALTPMDLLALQGLPTMVRGKPTKLDGDSVLDWREQIGDAVPRWSAKAIALSLLSAHLASKLGTWELSSTGYWVRRHDGYVQRALEASA